VILEFFKFHCVPVIVGHIICETLAEAHRRRGDDGRFEQLQPCEGRSISDRQHLAIRGPSDKRLKEARR
jgi:hypothetical protein